MEENNTTIRFGMSNMVSRSFEDGATIADLLSNRSILGALSAPEGCVAVSNGVTLSGDALVNSYTSVTLEQQASSKA
jgi:hypothetical protein